jgi:5-methylcytosine-specific restriction endonuclease McrA
VRKDKDATRRYNRLWVRRKRTAWIKENGPCVRCGSTRRLEIDHIDPSTKDPCLSRNSSSLWTRSEEWRRRELKKCQVLCRSCHIKKSAEELRGYKKDVPHGTRYRYDRGCRCEECRAENTARLKAYRRSIGVPEKVSLWNARLDARLSRLHRYGQSLREIGRGLGVSHVAAKQRLVKLGIYEGSSAKRRLK